MWSPALESSARQALARRDREAATLPEPPNLTDRDAGRRRVELRADCTRCFGLCCVAPAFAASADFAIDKAAGHACPNLQADSRCGIHARLRSQGFPGCAAYDCFGAGQHVAQNTVGGVDWRTAPRTAPQMFAVFLVMRQLHELLWYMGEALMLPAARPLHDELRRAFDETERLTNESSDALLMLDVAAHRAEVNTLLLRTSELVRSEVERPAPTQRTRRSADPSAGRRGALRVGANLNGADLIGKNLRGADLRGASLRGAYLIGADLRGADLRLADLIGADLRAADLRGADLTDSLFLTQSQLDAARGDATTLLPPLLRRPAHWPT
jgi:uncharacterized protein YjbI with pentapeptide repeats